jgi:hypothetical protein
MTVTASAISGILAKAGFKRANRRGTSWSSGFEAETFPSYVRIGYATVNSDQQLQTLKKMTEALNDRPDKKYWARVEPIVPGSTGLVVKVYAYDETDPQQNEERKAMTQEKLATDHPAAPAIADVKKALRTYSQYDADFYGFGYQVERLEEDTRLVRVRLVEAPYTTYEVDRDSQIDQTLANYARVVQEAGFEVQVRDEEMSVIVAMPGEWGPVEAPETVEEAVLPEESPEQVRTALLALREAVEYDSQHVSTRRSSDHSVFVMAFGNRVEVFYSNGEYKSKGRLGKGDWRRFSMLDSALLDYIVYELNA